jgi:hypothetical protein
MVIVIQFSFNAFSLYAMIRKNATPACNLYFTCHDTTESIVTHLKRSLRMKRGKIKFIVMYHVPGRLGGVVVSVLVTGPRGGLFKPGRGDGFWGAIKIRSTPSFGWEVKPEVPCRKILWHVKDPSRYLRYWQANSSFLRPFFLLAPHVSAGRTAGELWWTSQELFPAGIITTTMAFHLHISHWGWTIGPLVAAVLRHSLTPS